MGISFLFPSSMSPPTSTSVKSTCGNSQIIDQVNGRLQKTSVNCLNCVIDEIFIKVQIKDISDPLINEVIISKILENYEFIKLSATYKKIFPQYQNHCLYPYNGQLCKLMQTVAIPKIISLSEIFKNNKYKPDNMKIIFKSLCDLMTSYIECGKTKGITHNDLHLNNILCSRVDDLTNESPKFTMIDFGRSYIKTDGYNDTTEDYAKFGLTLAANYPILIENSFQIKDTELGYMCDVATLCINILPFYTVNECWFQYDPATAEITIDIKELSKFILIMNDTTLVFHKGLAWFALAYITRHPSAKPDENNIRIFNRNDYLRTTDLLFPNGVFIPQNYLKIKEQMCQQWPNLGSTRQCGGKLKRRQRGGICPPPSSKTTQKSEIIIPIVYKDTQENRDNIDACIDQACIPTNNLLISYFLLNEISKIKTKTKNSPL